MLVLPGGKVRSDRPSRSWQLANLRMAFVAVALRRRLGPTSRCGGCGIGCAGGTVRSSTRSTTPRQFSTGHATDSSRNRSRSSAIRWAAGSPRTWRREATSAPSSRWPRGGWATTVSSFPSSTRLLVVHGTADTWTDPRASRAQTLRAQQRGVDAEWVGLDGAGHYMARQWRDWHRLTGEFVAEQLDVANSDSREQLAAWSARLVVLLNAMIAIAGGVVLVHLSPEAVRTWLDRRRAICTISPSRCWSTRSAVPAAGRDELGPHRCGATGFSARR